jgi:tetratricopeptide (TPR) repeat protein
MASSARIDELRKKFDENPRRYFAPLANEYRKVGDLEQAVFICQEYLPQQPGHMSGHIVFGQTLFEMGRFDEAKSVFETALSLDPENLIALRHLGDIARQTGDIAAARNWYQRVLEADPRNDEIAHVMAALHEPPAAAESITSSAAPTPLATPIVPPQPERAPAEVRPETPPGGFQIEKSEDRTGLESSRVVAPEPSRAVPGSRGLQRGDDRSSAYPSALEDSDEFSLDDVSFASGTTGQSSPRPAQASPREAAGAGAGRPVEGKPNEAAVEADGQPLGPGLDRDAHDRKPDESIGPQSVAAGQRVELATDIKLGLVSEEPPPVPPSGLDRSIAEVGGLETYEAGVLSSGPVESASLETEAFFDPTPAGPPRPDDVRQGARTEPSIAPAGAFVTETMAELYLQQGHLDSAVDIYRKLLQQNPADATLRARLRALEDRTHGKNRPAEGDAGSVAAIPVYGGPTIREFLVGLASRRVPVAGIEVASPVSSPQPPSRTERSAVAENGSAIPDSAVEPPAAESRGLTHSADQSLSGSIDAIFSGADDAASEPHPTARVDEAPATADAGQLPLEGAPARRAANELSLDHVFKANAPPRSGSDDFSFDQFFGEGTPGEAAPGSGDPGTAPSEPLDDIAQFSSWLSGLKKT